jgi:hypothetical protein
MPIERIDTLVIGGAKKASICERGHIRDEEPVFWSNPQIPFDHLKRRCAAVGPTLQAALSAA